MSVCTQCRQSLRRALSLRLTSQYRCQSTTAAAPNPSIKDILSKPSWSIRSLLTASDASDAPVSKITPSQLHHLLRLSALPLPKSKAEEDGMIETLQRQLHFVRSLQQVDTTGVEPLRAIRDETEQGIEEASIGLGDLKDVLDQEEQIGFYKRPRRIKKETKSEAEDWDALKMASRKAGRFFVVQSKRGETEAP